MANFFSYLNSPEAQIPPPAPNVTQQGEGERTAVAAPDPEQFDEAADADFGTNNDGVVGEWILPDPATLHGGAQLQTPLDQLAAAAAATAFNPPTQIGGAASRNTPAPGPHDALRNVNITGGRFSPTHTTTGPEITPPVGGPSPTSALIRTCQLDETIKTATDLIAFLEWQAL